MKPIQSDMITLVDQLSVLYQQVSHTKAEHDRTVLQRHIDALEHELDQAVYRLYALNQGDIALIEASAN